MNMGRDGVRGPFGGMFFYAIQSLSENLCLYNSSLIYFENFLFSIIKKIEPFSISIFEKDIFRNKVHGLVSKFNFKWLLDNLIVFDRSKKKVNCFAFIIDV